MSSDKVPKKKTIQPTKAADEENASSQTKPMETKPDTIKVSASHREEIFASHANLYVTVKGSSLVVKVGTRVKNIRLVDEDHDIDCRIDGIGAMKLKSEFVKKVK